MALGISRTYLGGVVSHQGLVNRVASSSRVAASYGHNGLSLPTRGYAAASASLTKRGPVTGKGTQKDAHTPPPPLSKRKTAVQTPHKKTTSPEMDKAQHTSDPVPTKQHLAEEIAHKDAKKKDVEEENEEKLADLERMLAFQHLMPTVDPWGQSIEDTLDVMIPRPITHKLAGEKPLDKLKTVYATVSGNSKNWVKNTAALSALMSLDSIPGKSFYGLSWIAQIRASFGFLGTQSVKPDALLAPLRQMALESYEDLNKALANRNDKEITRLTTFTYQQQVLALSKASKAKNPKGRLIWQLHRTVSPVRVLSLRATEGYMSPTEPRFGNRMMIHALLKFETEQSLEMYTDRGVALHAPATEPHWVADTERVESWRVPAQRKRVTEYLVMEKRMWVQGPWQFREQLW